jgi:UDP-N-acetylmuramoyl-tripeptide--D-alanyl-D-alanine ligase
VIALSAAQLAALAGGVLSQAHGAELVTGVSIDSRTAQAGDLFVALPGERVDGHEHAADAFHGGASLALASRPVPGPAVLVADTQIALGVLAHHALAQLPQARVVGVTGSSGKTTTKDLLAHVLLGLGPVHAPPGSFNTEVGLPLTVLRAPRDTKHLVLEYGARGQGHLRYLCGIANPAVAVVLNVGSAHLGEFGSRAALAAAKAELLEGDGVAVLNADDPVVRRMATTRTVLLAGEAPDADVHVSDVTLDAQARAAFTLTHGAERAHVQLHLVGRHMVANAACAAAAALACGLDLAEVSAALATAQSTSRWRMETSRRDDGVIVINDAYNANPESMSAALEALVAMAGGVRSWAVLGEMRELGADSGDLHAQVGALTRTLGVDRVITVGDPAGALGRLRDAAGSQHVDVVEEAVELLGAELRPGDVVLVKASRSIGLERVAEGLLCADVQAVQT